MRTHNANILRILTLVTLLAALFALPVGPAMAADAVVKISPASSTVEVGQTVVVSVTIENVAQLYGAEFHLTFDPDLVEVVDANTATDGVQIAPGSFLAPDFVAQNQANNTAGTIDYAISQMAPHAAVSGSGTLATITFRGLASGTANLTFTAVILADPNGTEISASAQNGSVTVAGEATPPPPTATTPPPTTTTPPPTGNIQGYHVVRPGETLYSIGRAYGTRPNAIAVTNGIVNPNRIYVGVKLAIPVAPWSPIPAGPVAVRQFTPGGTVPTPVPTPKPGCRFFHTVQRGDTLTAIAIRYGSNIWAIGRANTIYNLNLIFPGQVLCIP